MCSIETHFLSYKPQSATRHAARGGFPLNGFSHHLSGYRHRSAKPLLPPGAAINPQRTVQLHTKPLGTTECATAERYRTEPALRLQGLRKRYQSPVA